MGTLGEKLDNEVNRDMEEARRAAMLKIREAENAWWDYLRAYPHMDGHSRAVRIHEYLQAAYRLML